MHSETEGKSKLAAVSTAFGISRFGHVYDSHRNCCAVILRDQNRRQRLGAGHDMEARKMATPRDGLLGQIENDKGAGSIGAIGTGVDAVSEGR